ncbi:MAG: hypothetical protein WBF33_28915 [Candidatus Nitrosopolaris sp.]
MSNVTKFLASGTMIFLYVNIFGIHCATSGLRGTIYRSGTGRTEIAFEMNKSLKESDRLVDPNIIHLAQSSYLKIV